MNTAQLKSFAQEARDILLRGVQNRLLFWGFDQKGTILEKPEEITGGCIFRGEVYDDSGILRKWHHLHRHIQKHSVKDALEQAAYTWFNRLIALSILEHNQLEDPVIIAIPEQSDPPILANAKQGKMGFLFQAEQEKVRNFILDNNDEKAFGTLLVGFCRSHPLLNRVFGSIDDFTELLLPGNLLSPGGILDHINVSKAISDNDYKEVELIGWLYQFYISEKKDEVFAGFKQNKKARPEDIPAATQIFTPRWIVKYMVENTLGKVWLNHSPFSPIREGLKYLVEHENQTSADLIKSVAELKLLDPAVGSGHILVVGFDLLLEMYKEEGFITKPAIREILKNNLFGVDIDSRATQLACFALLLKASLYDPEILKEDILPKIYAMPEADDFSRQEILEFLGSQGERYYEDLFEILSLLQQGKNIGSTLKLKLNEESRQFLFSRFNELKNNQHNLDIHLFSILIRICPFIEVASILTNKYESIATNPPYMGSDNMNSILKKYLESNYLGLSKDLMTTFMKVLSDLSMENGFWAIINIHTWLTKIEFLETRKFIIDSQQVMSLLHFGRGVFGSDFGTVSIVVRNTKPEHYFKTTFRKLFKTFVKVEKPEIKEKRFLASSEFTYFTNQLNFKRLPGYQFGYWLSNNIFSTIENSTIKDYGDAKQGIKTGNNERFVRYWFECDIQKTSINKESKKKKWFPINKGGEFRKWYGNNLYLINWENDGFEIKHFKGENGKLKSRPQNLKFFFTEGATWSTAASYKPSFRYSSKIFVFESSGSTFFLFNKKIKLSEILGYLNSKVGEYLIEVFSLGKGISEGSIKALPFITRNDLQINQFVDDLISLSKNDWDSQEISWDFAQNPLISHTQSIELSFTDWKKKVIKEFYKIHSLEENISQKYIEIYCLSKELEPNIPLHDITVLQTLVDRNELKNLEEKFKGTSKESIELPILKDEVGKQLISYLLGCLMGRYRLDIPGLNIAHPNPSIEELNSYTYNNHTIEIDQDAIIPILGDESPFSDDLNNRIRYLIEAIWGENTLTENINFIEDALGMLLEKFLSVKFWDYHKKMYKKTPIYWLFESPKGSFRVLTYMHRMDKYTLQKIRLNYLHRYIDHLSGEISRLKSNGDNPRRLEKLENALIDCREYSDILKPLSDRQITFDLDDGVKKNYKLFEGAVKPI